MKRFQLDEQWRTDFALLVDVIAEQREHARAGLQLQDHDAYEEARYQRELGEELDERIALLEHALWDLDEGPPAR